jgi:fructoselysine-6-P-deglycase FrlB-like protein
MLDVMEREIHAQPEYVATCLPSMRENLRGLALAADRVVMAGCGDSYYSAVAATAIFRSLGVPYVPATAQEVAQYLPLHPLDVVVLASVSGHTKRTLEAAERARGDGVATLAITCSDSSPLARACDSTLLLPYEPISRATPHTLDYTLTLLAQSLVAEHVAGQTIAALDRLPDALEAGIDEAFTALPAAVDGLASEASIFFLGAGADVGTAAYGAAKLHEAGGRTAFAGETENFWHGMNFMLRPTDLVMVFANRVEPAPVEGLLVANLVRLARTVVYVGGERVGAPHRVVVPPVPMELEPFVKAVVPQIACLLMARNASVRPTDTQDGMDSERHHMVQSAWFRR